MPKVRLAALVPALVVSALLIGMAPFLEQIRRAVREASADRYLDLLIAVFALGLAATVIWAVVQIRRRRLERYALLVAALGLMALQIFGWNRGQPMTDAVERIHFLFYGLIAFLYYRTWRPFGGLTALLSSFLAVAAVGILDEWVQWLVPLRVGELFDVVLNAYAGICGLLFGVAVLPLPRRGDVSAAEGMRHRRRLGLAVALFVLLLGGFLHSAHLGYRHYDADIGWFSSYFTREQLAKLSANRAAAWSLERPGPLTALEVEDYYRSEGGWHVSFRNGMRSNGNHYEAWKENLILERYYAPFLDLGHRLSPEEREALDRLRPEVDPYPFESGADIGRVFAWSKPLFWCVVVLLAAAVATLPLVVNRSSPPASPEPDGR